MREGTKSCVQILAVVEDHSTERLEIRSEDLAG
jgi:hypothetical protein